LGGMSPGGWDDDTPHAAFKAVGAGAAPFSGVDAGGSARRWEYAQETSSAPAIRIEMEVQWDNTRRTG